MASLTPQHRSDEATSEAMQEGLISGGFVFLPCMGALYIAMQNKTFMARTNWQSRTALVIMPTLFVFSLASETHLKNKMDEIAKETQHSMETVRWAEAHHREAVKGQAQSTSRLPVNNDLHLSNMYKQSVQQSGVNIVPGNKLEFHHRLANFVAANPIKVLAGLAVPSVALIFYGRTGKDHLQFSVKLLHTRVFGQFTTIALLLGIMGFKDYMDHKGRFITEEEANRRVEEMKQIRINLLNRLDYENEVREQQERELAEAHAIIDAAKQARLARKEKKGDRDEGDTTISN